MKSKFHFPLIILSFLLFTCERTVTVKKQEVSASLNIEIKNEKYILVVPQNGCSNCVFKSYQLIQKHNENGNVKFIFTNFSSEKAVKIRLRQLGVPNVDAIGFVGLEEILNLGGSSMFPLLLHIENEDARLKILNDPNDKIWTELNDELSGTPRTERLF